MDIKFKEKDYENRIIKKFEDLNYIFIDEETMKSKRKYNNNEIILYEILEEKIRLINKGIDEEEIKQLIRKVKDIFGTGDLIKRNKEALNLLKFGSSPIKNKKEQRYITRRLIDFDNIENNEFIITNQFKVRSNHEEYKNQIPDFVILINGIPVIVGELKRLETNEDKSIVEAENQMRGYVKNISKLFSWNIFNFISNISTTKIGTILTNKDEFYFWRNEKRSSSFFDIMDSLFKKDIILDIIKNFVFYTKDDDKILSKYYQYNAVNKSIEKFSESTENDENKVGIIWHTQGSGKSYSMVMLSNSLIKQWKELTILVVTDRKSLDAQLFNTFDKCFEYLGQKPYRIESIKDLKEQLKDIKAHGIFFTTIQKFQEFSEENKILSNRKDIIIMTDEAHRSNNIKEDFKIEQGINNLIQKESFAFRLRQAFPNGKFIGFTGTPIEKNTDFDTKKTFGDYIDIYPLAKALEDESIVPIYYQNSKLGFSLSKEEMELIDKEDEEENLAIENDANIKMPSEVLKAKNKRKIQEIMKHLHGDERVSIISKHLIEHYKKRQGLLKDKAMLVVQNRELAFKYYKKILELEPEWKDKVRLIVTPSKTDSKEMSLAIGTSQERKNWEDDFKYDNGKIKILIVVDMLLTGYDVPSLDIMYFDKVLKMHNLMQAIARTNRKYIDKNNPKIFKRNGLIVDYIGIFPRIKEALDFYWDNNLNDITNECRDVESVKTTFLEKKLDLISSFDYEKQFEIIKNNIEKFEYTYKSVQEKDLIPAFVNSFKALEKLFIICSSLLEENDILEFRILREASNYLIKQDREIIYDRDNYIERLRKHLNGTIIYEGFENTREENVDIEKIKTSLQKEVIENDAVNIKEKINQLKIYGFELIKRSKMISIKRRQKLSEKLEEIFRKFKEDSLTLKEFMEHIKALEKELKEKNREKTEEELCVELFIDAIKVDENMNDKNLKRIAEIIYKEIVDGNVKKFQDKFLSSESNKQKFLGQVGIILLREGYPPEYSKKSSKDVINQLTEIIENNQ